MNKKMKQLLRMLIVAAMLLIGTMTAYAVTAEAAYTYPSSSFKQTAWKTNSATVTWENYTNNYSSKTQSDFEVLLGTSYSDVKVVKKIPANSTSYTFNGLQDGKRYYVRVRSSNNPTDATGGYIETIPARVKNFRQDRWYYWAKSLYVAWDRIDSADKYEVKFYNYKGKLVKSENMSGYSASASLDKVTNQVYTVTVRAGMDVNGTTVWTPVSTIQCFHQAMLKSIKQTSGALTIKWDKVGGATGYDVYVSTKPKTGYKKVKSLNAGKGSFTIKKVAGKKVQPKKKYYVYVVTRKGNNGSGKLYYWNSRKGASLQQYF